jgi:Tol biopolymer transport system component
VSTYRETFRRCADGKRALASPVAHSLAGLGIYWASLRNSGKTTQSFSGKHAAGAVLAVFLANLSDADLLLALIARRYMHHQATHTLLFALVTGAAAALAAPLFRIKPLRAFGVVSLLVGSHVILDFLTRDTSYPRGCMLFWPVSNRYYISPVPVFLDIWRATPALMFGYHNINAVVRELAAGALFLTGVHWYHRFPLRAAAYLPHFTIAAGIVAAGIHVPLNAKAREQVMAFWKMTAPVTDPELTKGILYTSKKAGNSDIYRIQPDGSGAAQLTVHPGEDLWPVWSPDGQWIAFQSDRAGEMDIWIMKADGSDKRNLTARSDAANETPSWTPDGNQIVFSSDRDGHFGLYIMARNGTSIKRITPETPGHSILPAVSPVQGRAVYTEKDSGAPGWHIRLMSLNRGQSERISPGFGCRARWSPDGNQVCYVADDLANATGIFILSLKDGSSLQATYSTEYDYDPCYSPHGNQICFARGKHGRKHNWDLWILDLDTGREYQLTFDGMDNRYPSWR